MDNNDKSKKDYKIEMSDEVLDQLNKLPPEARAEALKVIERMKANFRLHNIMKLVEATTQEIYKILMESLHNLKPNK